MDAEHDEPPQPSNVSTGAPTAASSQARPSGTRALIFSIVFWGTFALSSIVGFLVSLVVLLVTLPFDRNRRIYHHFVCGWVFAHLRANPLWDIQFEGRENLPTRAAVIVANHQSGADIPVTMGIGHPFKYVAKDEMFRVPVVGQTMRLAGYVPVNRRGAKSMRRMMEQCKRWLRRGEPILIFPEGTFALDGKLLPFKKGAFQLAIGERVPVVPIVIEGTTSLVYDQGPLLSPRARVRARVLPAIPVEELGDDPTALAARVRAIYEEALAATSR